MSNQSSKVSNLSTRDRIVHEATKLLQYRSYNSFSYNDISEAIGIKKASIHYYFQTKEILGAEIIKNFRSKVEYLTHKLDTTHDDPIVRLEYYFDWFARGLERNLICPAGVFSVEFNTLPPEIQDEHKALFEYYINWLANLLQNGKDRGVLDFEETAEQKAFYIASLMEGAMLFARTTDSIDHYYTVVNQVKSQILA